MLVEGCSGWFGEAPVCIRSPVVGIVLGRTQCPVPRDRTLMVRITNDSLWLSVEDWV